MSSELCEYRTGRFTRCRLPKEAHDFLRLNHSFAPPMPLLPAPQRRPRFVLPNSAHGFLGFRLPLVSANEP